MKRLIALCAAAALIATMSAGCSKNTGKAQSTARSKSVTSSSASSSISSAASGVASSVSKGTSASGQSTKAGGGKTVATTGLTNAQGTGTKNPLQGVNLGGKTITIAAVAKDDFQTSMGSSKYANAIASRTALLQKQLNCKIVLKVDTADHIGSNLNNALLAGSKYADLIETGIGAISGMMASGSLKNLKNVSSLDLTQPYMNACNMVNQSTIGKAAYSVTTDEIAYSCTPVIFFNQRLLKTLPASDNPYTLMKNNQWTISTLRAIAKAATKDTDGKTGMSVNDQYGLLQVSMSQLGAESVLGAYGAQMLKNDGNGNVSYNMDDTSVINAINMAHQFYKLDGSAYGTDSNDQQLYDMFKSGHALFLSTYLKGVESLSDMDDDFGLVPFPRDDSYSKYINYVNWNAHTFVVPSGMNAADYTAAGEFLQAFCYESENVTLPALVNEYSSRYLRDDTSSSMMLTVLKDQTINEASILGSQGNWTIHLGTYKVLYACVPGTTQTVPMIQSTKNATVQAINELISTINKHAA